MNLVFLELLKVQNLTIKKYINNYFVYLINFLQLSIDTWFYAKRCFLSLIETLAKHMIIIKDTSFSEIIDFLDAAD